MTFQRARRPEHKRQRYEAILAAARALGVQEGVRAVSLADIAGAVGVHKSALLRYFETREEIYLRIAAEEWADWAGGMRAALAGLAQGSVGEVAAAFASTLAERPLLCDLLSHTSLNLERNVSLDAARAYKRAATDAITAAAAAVRTVLPELSERDTVELVGAVNTMAAGLWQAVHPPPVFRTLFEQEPDLGHADYPFEPTIARLAETLVLGLRARGE